MRDKLQYYLVNNYDLRNVTSALGFQVLHIFPPPFVVDLLNCIRVQSFMTNMFTLPSLEKAFWSKQFLLVVPHSGTRRK